MTLLLSETHKSTQKMYSKIAGSEHSDANFKRGATTINELCIPKTVPRNSTECCLCLNLMTD